jgi:hypothetical protein
MECPANSGQPGDLIGGPRSRLRVDRAYVSRIEPGVAHGLRENNVGSREEVGFPTKGVMIDVSYWQRYWQMEVPITSGYNPHSREIYSHI